jgi:hypothetical protein
MSSFIPRAFSMDPNEFDRCFPPISDEEFLARCTPGTNPDIALRVRRVVSEHLDVPYERIHPSARFIQDLGAG